MSPGWQSSTSQMASKVLNIMALAFPVFKIENLIGFFKPHYKVDRICNFMDSFFLHILHSFLLEKATYSSHYWFCFE
jgi:hypothetical protein